MVPKYLYQVRSTYRLTNSNKLREETHNYEILAAAWSYRDVCIRKGHCVRVQILCVLDDTTKGNFEDAKG
jgi:hypothetical protein